MFYLDHEHGTVDRDSKKGGVAFEEAPRCRLRMEGHEEDERTAGSRPSPAVAAKLLPAPHQLRLAADREEVDSAEQRIEGSARIRRNAQDQPGVHGG